MRAHQRLLLVFCLSTLAGCGTANEGFKLIHVDDVVGMLGASDGSVTLLDANGTDFRNKEGVIPGAVLLSSYSKYDVDKELPSRKDAPLVFYCADTH